MSSAKDPNQGGSRPGRENGKGKGKEGSPSVGQKIIEKVIKKKKEPKPTLGLRRQPYVRWNTKGLGLIDRIENTPADWDGRDDDIDEDDLVANIQRCKDRIEDNIMPQLWEWKLKYLEEDYAKVQAMIQSEPAGLSDEVITRLKSLEIIHKQTVKNGDEYCQIKNIEAIMSSYRQAKLTWRNGKVTYWADGNCISKDYEVFDEKRFGNLSDEYVKKRRTQQDPYPKAGIWVEGLDSPGPGFMFINWLHSPWIIPRVPEHGGIHHNYFYSVRVPYSTTGKHCRWQFFDDTGASKPLVYKDDIEHLVYMCAARPRFLGHTVFKTADTPRVFTNIEVEMCIEDDYNNMRTPWVRAEICARPERNRLGDKRYSASFARRMMYQATVPNGQNNLIFAKNKTSLTSGSHFPAVDITQSTAPPESVAFTPTGPLWAPLLRLTNFDQPDIVTVPTILAPTAPPAPPTP